jgi:hypothetical protein
VPKGARGCCAEFSPLPTPKVYILECYMPIGRLQRHAYGTYISCWVAYSYSPKIGILRCPTWEIKGP